LCSFCADTAVVLDAVVNVALVPEVPSLSHMTTAYHHGTPVAVKPIMF